MKNNKERQTIRTKQTTGSNEDVLKSYYEQMNSVPLLSREEEKRLALLANEGETWAKEKLVVANLRIVVKIARKYVGRGLPLSDLISEGNIGLMRAVDTYDVGKGCQFVSYAVYWIKQSILKCVAEKSKLVRMPMSWNNATYRISEIYADSQRNSKGVSRKELLKEVGVSERKLLALQEFVQPHLSLDEPVESASGGDVYSLQAIIANTNSENPEDAMSLKTLKQSIKKAFSGLKVVEKEILEGRFGLKTEKKTLEELGRRFKLTKERIRQIEKVGLDKLKIALAKVGVEELAV